MYNMDGFLEGKPKVLRNTSYEFLKQQDGYFIRIKIIKLNKHLDFPLTSKINEEMVLEILQMIWIMKLYILIKLD